MTRLTAPRNPQMRRAFFLVLAAASAVAAGTPGRAQAQTDPLLGAASDFSVLAGSTVTNTGTSFIQGNVGVTPGTDITGVSTLHLSDGTLHPNSDAAQQAQTAVGTAYTALKDWAFTANLTGENLGSRTLAAGVYFFSSSVLLTGPLVLDGGGDPNAQFIFQIGSTLTTETSSSVRFINGGNARNVYWQVGSSATIGTSSEFNGNILAQESITVGSGAILDFGRLLARTGAVTLNNNRISAPVGAAAPEPSSIALLAGMAFPLAGFALRRRRAPFAA